MDPKLLCPTLTIMLTKTIKALCEVNIKFDRKLEISGSLHVRSDGEKILTCLIDEDSTRTTTGGLIHQRSTPETALAQQSAVMALLTASQQMAANRSPGLSSPPTRNGTPNDLSHLGDSVQQLTMTQPHLTVQSSCKTVHPSNSIQHTSTQEVIMEQHTLPPVNSLIHPPNDREVLLGMLQDRSKKSTEVVSSHNSHSNPIVTQNTNNSHIMQVHVKKEPECVSSVAGCVARSDPLTMTTAGQPATANGSAVQALSALPPFPVLVGGAFPPPTMAAIATATTPTPKTDPDSPPRENEYVTTINSKGQKKFQCMFCGILLSTKNYLKNHINAVHTKARVYPCEICERYFYSAGALRIHKLRHHWAGSKKHKCAHCQESFLLPVELRRHLVKKHGDTTSGHSEDEGGESPRATKSSEATAATGNLLAAGGLTIHQIHQMQLREQLRAQQHLYEQEQAIQNLQRQISEQNSPVELSSRGDSVGEEREPGELLTEELHTQVTVANAVEEVQSAEHTLISHFSQQPVVTSQQVVVQPEAPSELVNNGMEIELHSNQNEAGVCAAEAGSG